MKKSGNTFYVSAYINIANVKFLVDSGASLSFVSTEYLNSVLNMFREQVWIREYHIPCWKGKNKFANHYCAFLYRWKVYNYSSFYNFAKAQRMVYFRTRRLRILEMSGEEIGWALESGTTASTLDIRVVHDPCTHSNLVGFTITNSFCLFLSGILKCRDARLA